MKKFNPFHLEEEETPVSRPYVIAEAGVNHECNIDTAKRQIELAAEGGAHAIKFQTYKAETLASKDSPAYWDRTKEAADNQYQLFKRYDKFWKAEYEILKNHCDKFDIDFLSTPFDVESADFLNDLMSYYKISSSDLTNLPFIEYMCKFGKPIILSTGASELWEIERAISVIKDHRLPFCLMHCVLNYPTLDENANLGMLVDLQCRFPEAILGYSDHTLPGDMYNLEVATTLGAKIIEKHFTHDKTLEGNDHYHAMDKEDLIKFNSRLDRLFGILGSFEKKALDSEAPARANARRSLVANVDITEGAVIEESMLTWKRPAAGITPADLSKVIGKTALKNISQDEVLKWNMLS